MADDWDATEITGKPPEEVGRDLISFMERTERPFFMPHALVPSFRLRPTGFYLTVIAS